MLFINEKPFVTEKYYFKVRIGQAKRIVGSLKPLKNVPPTLYLAHLIPCLIPDTQC